MYLWLLCCQHSKRLKLNTGQYNHDIALAPAVYGIFEPRLSHTSKENQLVQYSSTLNGPFEVLYTLGYMK